MIKESVDLTGGVQSADFGPVLGQDLRVEVRLESSVREGEVGGQRVAVERPV